MRTAIVALLLLAATSATAAPPNVDATEPLEKELSSLARKLEALKGELDRVDDMASTPVATSVAMEIAGDKGVAAPTGYRLTVNGRVEEERDFGKGERDLFSGDQPASSLSVRIPLLPGSYRVRLDLSGPGWKSPPFSEFPLTLKKGDAQVVKLRLALPAAVGGDPTLRPAR